MLTIYEQSRTKLSLWLIRFFIIIATAIACYALAEPTFQALLHFVPLLQRNQEMWRRLVWFGLAFIGSVIIYLSFRISRQAKTASLLPQSLILDPVSCRLTHYCGGKIIEAKFRYLRDFTVTGFWSKRLTLNLELTDAHIISFSLPRVKWSKAIERELTSYRQAHELLARLQALDDSKYHSASLVAERIYREVHYPGHHWDKPATPSSLKKSDDDENAVKTDAHSPNHKTRDDCSDIPKDHLKYVPN